MSPPISSSVKEKVIQLHLDGKGRNEIAEILNHSHIRISQGSVTNILNTWKREQGNSDTSQPVASPKAVLSKATPQASPPSSSPDNNMGSPFLNRVANPTPTVTTVSTPVKVNPPHEPSSPDPQSSLSQNSEGDVPSIESMKDPEGPKTQEEQGPNGSIEHTKGSEEPKGHEVPIAPATSTPATITTSSTLIPSSSSRSPFPVPEVSPYLTGVNSYPYPYSHFNLGYLNPQISQVNIGLVNPICIQDSEETTHEEAQEVQDQDQSSEAHDQEESFMDLGWSTVFRQIEEDKKQRRDELLLIEQKKKELEQQRMQIDRARYDLENREIRIIEAEPLIPIARQLQDLGTDINQFLPWVETIHEEAEAWKLDLTTASYRVAQDLRLYRQVGSLQKSIQQMQERLTMLNMIAMQKERALMVLMELQNRGVSLEEIYGLSKILDLNILVKEWHYDMSIGRGDGNNTNMNGGGNGGFNLKDFKLDDKLNCVV